MILDAPLETDRLVLRNLDVSEARGPYLDWFQDEEVMRFIETRFAEITPESLEQFIETINASNHSLMLGLFLKPDLRHIGNIKLGPLVREHQRASLGVLIGDKSVWGQGLAAEAIRAMSDYGLHELGLHRISAACYKDNVASYKAFMKCGFEEDGRLRDYFWTDTGWQECILMCRIAEDR